MTIRAPAAIEASERFQAVRAEGATLLTVLASESPRSTAAMAAVTRFQQAADVVGENDVASGLLGPATVQALEFFMPVGTQIPVAWDGTTPGTWTPPAWTRTITEGRPIWWFVALFASWATAGAIVIGSGIADARSARKGGGR